MSVIAPMMRRFLCICLILSVLLCASPLVFASGESTPAAEQEETALPPAKEDIYDDADPGEEPDETAVPEEPPETQVPYTVVVPDAGIEEPMEENIGAGDGDEIEHDPDDPLYGKMRNGVSTVALAQDNFEQFTTRALNNETLRMGIDVSEWQGDINWTAVAASGIEFVFVRVAFRGSSTGALKPDACYAKNLAGAKAAGLKVGAYIFSQALDAEEGEEEAAYLANLVSGYGIDLPLVIDYEYAGYYGRLYEAKLSRQTATDACIAFCDAVERLGYDSMVYANSSMFSSQLCREQLGRVWLAHYTTNTSYAGAYEYWQCSCTGSINGISGDVDLDFWFQPNTASQVPPSSNGAVQDPSGTGADNPFGDVQAGSWYYESVLKAYRDGIVKGISESVFSPGGTATRGQVITMLYRLQDEPDVTAESPFTDLTADYYKDAVDWASSSGVVKGISDTEFGPDQYITREHLVTMLYRLAESPAPKGSAKLGDYSDGGDVHSYGEDAMLWAVEQGIITGYADGSLRPNANATRAEVCAILIRFDSLSQ